MNLRKHKIFAPLQRYEDKEKVKWLIIGAITAIAGFLIGRLI